MKTKTAKQTKQAKPKVQVKDIEPKKDVKAGSMPKGEVKFKMAMGSN